MSRYHTGNIQPQLDYEEHVGLANAKRVVIVGSDGSNYFEVKVNASGQLSTTGGGGGGAVTTNYEYAEDSGHVSGNVGAFVLGVRNGVLADLTTTDGDYSPIAVDAKGRLIVDPSSVTSPVAVQNAVNVQDGGGSLTVDDGGLTLGVDDNGGSLTVDAVDLDIRNLVFATDKVDASGTTLGANSGVDIGDVTINNASGASAVNIQDGGNSITVDGTVTADTELPAAAALADDTSNPTTPLIGACTMEFDGTTWDRTRHSFIQTRTGVTNASGAGTAVDMTTTPCKTFTGTVVRTSGTVSAFTIPLEGSLDNTNWFTLVAMTSVSGADQMYWIADRGVRYMRSNVTSIAGAGGTVTVTIHGMR